MGVGISPVAASLPETVSWKPLTKQLTKKHHRGAKSEVQQRAVSVDRFSVDQRNCIIGNLRPSCAASSTRDPGHTC